MSEKKGTGWWHQSQRNFQQQKISSSGNESCQNLQVLFGNSTTMVRLTWTTWHLCGANLVSDVDAIWCHAIIVMTRHCFGLHLPVQQLIIAASLLSHALSSLPPPKENFRKVEKRILDKLFSPKVYDNRMRPKGKPLKVKSERILIGWPLFDVYWQQRDH